MIDNENIIVSVVCTTYNQEKFIRNALDGFISQKTTFPIEIIIHDDASTDSTAEIVREYEAKYSTLFNCIYRKDNWYSQGKNIWSYLFAEVAKGKYIAICEGDDYWIDPYKLQKQVDFLESNKDCGLVHTATKYYIQSTGLFSNESNVEEKREIGFESLIRLNTLFTPTILLKRSLTIDAINDKIFDQGFLMSDYPLWLYIAKKTKIGYIDDITSVYRVQEESASHSKNSIKQFVFRLSAWDIRCYFAKDTVYNDEIIKGRYLYCYDWLIYAFNENQKVLGKKAYLEMKNSCHRNKNAYIYYLGTQNPFFRIIIKMMKKGIELFRK